MAQQQTPRQTTRQIEAPRPKMIQEFFVYSAEFLALAAGTMGSASITIQADSDFYLQKLTGFADIAAAAQTAATKVVPLVSINILDTGSGRQLSDRPIPFASLFGSGDLPFILTAPRVFTRTSTIAIQATNFDAAVTYNLRLAFIGYKTYQL